MQHYSSPNIKPKKSTFSLSNQIVDYLLFLILSRQKREVSSCYQQGVLVIGPYTPKPYNCFYIAARFPQMSQFRKNHIQQSALRTFFNNPEAVSTHGAPGPRATYGQTILQRSPKSPLGESISFISPKKIAFYQKIDESCLNEEERSMLTETCRSNEKYVSPPTARASDLEIDYKSIKKCLSPRSPAPYLTTRLRPDFQRQQKALQTKADSDKQFYEKMITDLKFQVLQMGRIIEEKDREIQEREGKIMQLQKELFQRERRLQTSDLSVKSISTSLEDKSMFTSEMLPLLGSDDFSEKMAELEQKIKRYECKFDKLMIEIDILRKNKFDRQRCEAEMTKLLKKNEKLNKKIDQLVGKNINLELQLAKYLKEMRHYHDESIEFQFSPEKGK